MKRYDRKDNPQLWFDFCPEYEKQPVIENPQNETEKYINAQSRWIETQSPDAWKEMWSIIEILARKALTIECKSKGLVFDDDKKEQVVFDVISEILDRYVKWRGYRIDYIATQVRLCIKLVLYEAAKKDKFEKELVKQMQQCKDYDTALQMARQIVLEEKQND